MKRIVKMFYQIVVGRSIRAVYIYRSSRWFYTRKLKPLGQLFWSMNVMLHSIEISPLAKIGKNFRLAHSAGTVIGGGVVIGENVTVYQNVTLGTKKDSNGGKSYPTIGNNVTIYPGCVIVGGINIGDNVVIGANSVVLKDVPPNTTVAGIPAKKII